MGESRLKKSIINAKVNVLFYFVTLVVSFFSRKIFLEGLGDEFVGLTGTLMNLLGFLNLAELGIGSAIGYVLYKPIFDKDTAKINEIISVFGYLYRWIGFIILGAGVILSCFLPLIFADASVNIGAVYFAFYSFLASSLIGYFINYRQTLLGADQKNYVVTAYFQTMTIAKTIIQMAIAYYTGSYILWIGIELIFGISYSFVLNWKINKVYPWLKSSVTLGKQKYPENKIIIQKAKQMFVHVLAGTGRSQLLPFLVYAFTSLKIVAFYGNYMLIITKINLFVNNFLDSTRAGVGNLVAEGNKDNILKIFWQLSALRFMIAAFLTFALAHLINPFIQVWLGKEYLLEESVIIIILSNFFISQFRGTNDQFIYGYGLYQDTWAPIVTLIITVSVAIGGGYLWGLPGVLLGDVASSITIISVWKPYFLFSQGFKMPVYSYWKSIFKYIAVYIACWGICEFIFSGIGISELSAKGYSGWCLYSIIVSAIFGILYTLSMYCCSKGAKEIMQRLFLKRLLSRMRSQ